MADKIMTHDEIQNLKPGAMLDNLVAKKVMGWHAVPECPLLHPGDKCNGEIVPNYSTDGSVLEVIEKMLTKTASCVVHHWDDDGDGHIRCYFEWAMYQMSGHTISEAVCKAALYYVECKKREGHLC